MTVLKSIMPRFANSVTRIVLKSIMPQFANHGIMTVLKSIIPLFVSTPWEYGFQYCHNQLRGNDYDSTEIHNSRIFEIMTNCGIMDFCTLIMPQLA